MCVCVCVCVCLGRYWRCGLITFFFCDVHFSRAHFFFWCCSLTIQVKALMEAYDASLGEWKRYQFWDETKHYTRNLIATDHENFTLMLLCWTKGKGSPVHSHAGSECWLRVVQGHAREVKYAWPEEEEEEAPLEVTFDEIHPAGEVTFIDDSIGLHKVESAQKGDDDEDRFVSLHLYAPPYEQCLCFGDGDTCKPTVGRAKYHTEYGVKVEYNC